METFENFILIFFIITVVLFLVVWIGAFLTITAYKFRGAEKTKTSFLKFLGNSLTLLIISIIILSALSYNFKRIIREDLQEFLNETEISINIKDKTLNTDEKNILLKDLKNITKEMRNRPGPDPPITITLFNRSKSYSIRLARDTNEKDLYWLYVNNYKTTSSNDIGKIRTKLFN